MSITQEIKARLDIVDYISDFVPLKRSGRNFSGMCPFHDNSRTPAFYVNPERQSWRCFGACAEGGDIFAFVMKREGVEFPEALKMLAARANVEVPEFRPKPQEQKEAEDRLGDLTELAADYFNQLLLHAPEAEEARQYVRSRDLTRGSVKTFKLGFSLDSFDACRTHFTGIGYSEKELIDVGLLTVNEDKGTTYDRFRNRLMFPIHNDAGRIVGFGARTLEKDGIPKYLNSPQTLLFDKSRLLYGLAFGKRDVREAREAVIVEGYMDVIRAHQNGFRNVIAQMGTALTESQLQLLKRFTKRFVIALDADEAGVRATMRSLDVARETLDREIETSIDARGLLRHEGRLKADIRIATMPEGKDPDDIITEDPAEWLRLIKEAEPVVSYVIKSMTADLDMGDAKAKSAVAERVMPLISDIADSIERSHFRQQLATTLGIDERTLERFVVRPKKRRQPQQVRSAPPPPSYDDLPEEPADLMAGADDLPVTFRRSVAPLAIEQIESNFLRQAIAHPEMMVRVDMLLRQAQQPAITSDDFTSSEDRLVWQAVRRRAVDASTGTLIDVEEMCNNLDAVLSERVRGLLAITATADTQVEQLSGRLTHSVLNWRLDKVRRTLGEVKDLMEIAKREGDEETGELHAYRCQELTAMIYSINRARHTLSSASQRD